MNVMSSDQLGISGDNIEELNRLLRESVQQNIPVSMVLAHGYRKTYVCEILNVHYLEEKRFFQIKRKPSFIVALSLSKTQISPEAITILRAKPIILYLKQQDLNFFVYGRVVQILSLEKFTIECELETRLFKRRKRVFTRFVNPLNDSQREAAYWIKDISVDGLCVIARQPLDIKEGDELLITVIVPQVQNNSLYSYINQEWQVDIVNIREGADGLELGCRLNDRRHEVLPTIQKYILKLQQFDRKSTGEFKLTVPPIKIKEVRVIT